MTARRLCCPLLLILLLSAAPSPASVVSVSSWGSSDQFGSFTSLEAPQSLTDSFCIGSHSGSYMITFQSANGSGGQFHLASGAALMAYRVEFAPNGGDFSPISAGGTQQAETSVKNCSAKAANVALRLTLDPADFNSAPVGVYSDTLTAVISDI